MIDTDGMEDSAETKTVLALIEDVRYFLGFYRKHLLTDGESESQSSSRLLWFPADAFIGTLANVDRNLLLNEVPYQGVADVSSDVGESKSRRADMLLRSNAMEIFVAENSLCAGSARKQAQHTLSDAVKMRKAALAAMTSRKSTTIGGGRVIMVHLGREETSDSWMLSWCHAEPMTVVHDGRVATVFAIRRHKDAVVRLASLYRANGAPAAPVLTDESAAQVRAFQLSLLDACCHAIAFCTERSVAVSTPVREAANTAVLRQTGGRQQSRRGDPNQPAGGPNPNRGASAGPAPGNEDRLDANPPLGVVLNRPWGTGPCLPLLLGPTLEAALAADSRQAERWDVPGAHSCIYGVRGHGPRASAPQLVLKMAPADESRAFLRRERRALQRLQGLHCVVQPTAWVQCTDGGPEGFLMPFCAAFPVEACVSRPDTAVAFLGKVTDALVRLHACDVAHGDLKPDVFRTDSAASGIRTAAALTASALPPLRLLDFNLSLSASTRPEFARDRHWGTPPYCLSGWAPRSGAAVDCVALSSLLAQWCNLPASVGGPGGPAGVSDFAERLDSVRALVREWQDADVRGAGAGAPTAERSWQFKALALQLMLLERCEELSLQTIWQVWLHEFWLARQEAQLSLLLGLRPEGTRTLVCVRGCSRSGGCALTRSTRRRRAMNSNTARCKSRTRQATSLRACVRRPLTLFRFHLQNDVDGPRRRDAESSKRAHTPASARAPLSDLTQTTMR